MDSKAMNKLERLLADKLAEMMKDQFKDWIAGGIKFIECDTIFEPIWEGYVRSLSDGVSSWSDYSFVVIQDPWDIRREIPISTEVATKALVLGAFP